MLFVGIFCYSLLLWYNVVMGKYSGYTPAKKRANEKYLTTKVDNILVRVPKGKKAEIQDIANEQGISVNQFIVDAIDHAIDQHNNSNA